MKIAQQAFGGQLMINGSYQQQSTTGLSQLASGLRIRGQESSTEEALLTRLTEEAEKTGDAVTGTENKSKGPAKSGSVSANFYAQINARAAAGNDDSQAAALLVRSLSSTANKISSEFGQEKANEFMSKILTATDKGLNEATLGTAISGFFQDLASESNTNSLVSPKFMELKNFLNQGLDAAVDEHYFECGGQTGLAYAMNSYFGSDPVASGDGTVAEVKGFDANFDRVGLTLSFKDDSQAGAATAAANFTGDYLVGTQVSDMVAAYLRDEIGNEEAAAYIEGLALGSNFMEALATSAALVVNQNGLEAATDYFNFLNGEVKSVINRTNDQVDLWKFRFFSAEEDRSGWARFTTDPEKQARPEQPSEEEVSETPKFMGQGMDIRDCVMIPDLDWYLQGRNGFYFDTSTKSSGPYGSFIAPTTLDMDDLYEQYLNGKSAGAAPTEVLNSPVGNLVSTKV